jgi:hypothetical protein
MNTKHHLAIAKMLAKLLDTQFGIGKFKFGLDPLIGLVPWVGDALTLSFSLYLFWIAYLLKLPTHAKSQILMNIFIDFILGMVPVIGDVGDFIYKGNSRNWAIIQKYTKTHIIEDAEIVD